MRQGPPLRERNREETMRRLFVLGAALALSLSFFAAAAFADIISGFTEKVSPDAQTNATEPSVAVDRSDGTIYIAWQASGTHVARSDNGGGRVVQTPLARPPAGGSGGVGFPICGPPPSAAATPTRLSLAPPGFVASLSRLRLPPP